MFTSNCICRKKLKNVTHVIFDLNGTLLDSEKFLLEAIQKIAYEYGKRFPQDICPKLLGTLDIDKSRIAIEAMNLPLTPEEFVKKFHDYSNEKLKKVTLLPGVEKLVRHLHSQKIPMAVVSSSPNEMLKLEISNHEKLFSLFHHFVMAGDDPDVENGKPAPDIYLICAGRFEEPIPQPEQCLVFEDSPNGVASALAAGMQVIMIPSIISAEIYCSATMKLDSLDDFQPEKFGLPSYLMNSEF